uniref:Arrestin domain-containing protein 3-like n=1 Tax=Poecilia reticulata TaxID=8081 RepID=A0A3P9N8T0_POERE
MTIKHFQIEYDAINRRNIFTNGDTINGRIILEAVKKTRIQSLVFKATGKASLRLVNYYGNIIDREDERDDQIHLEKIKYYRIKQDILKEGEQEDWNVIEKGRHVFPFSFKVPNSRKIPSSFCSVFGQIVHTLKAELKQLMKLTKKAETHFTFVCKPSVSGLMLTMSLHCTGEALRVRLEIENLSSRSVKPKFVLDEKKIYFGINRSKIQKHEILKEKADAVESFSGKTTVIKEITIPQELSPSILNCSIIKIEYRLKVSFTYLVVKLPIVIIPELSGENPSGRPNQPAWMSQPTVPPPPYEEYAMYPSFPFGV